ncbi:hypothetical protein DHBDCA_p2805 [Dehalobacter sp. DCA]|nr:hypothetical protein DHBDCA_p2805 [Dehalobacter sp. DCA]AFV06815.1 hypothetical protein DCF50_p2812 [Dehalobacter sp. CF]
MSREVKREYLLKWIINVYLNDECRLLWIKFNMLIFGNGAFKYEKINWYITKM